MILCENNFLPHGIPETMSKKQLFVVRAKRRFWFQQLECVWNQLLRHTTTSVWPEWIWSWNLSRPWSGPFVYCMVRIRSKYSAALRSLEGWWLTTAPSRLDWMSFTNESLMVFPESCFGWNKYSKHSGLFSKLRYTITSADGRTVNNGSFLWILAWTKTAIIYLASRNLFHSMGIGNEKFNTKLIKLWSKKGGKKILPPF